MRDVKKLRRCWVCGDEIKEDEVMSHHIRGVAHIACRVNYAAAVANQLIPVNDEAAYRVPIDRFPPIPLPKL